MEHLYIIVAIIIVILVVMPYIIQPKNCYTNTPTRIFMVLQPEKTNVHPQQNYNTYEMNKLSPAGETNSECMWRGICNRQDNTMGVCMSGLCYPNTHVY
jgi:hypothetical protein